MLLTCQPESAALTFEVDRTGVALNLQQKDVSGICISHNQDPQSTGGAGSHIRTGHGARGLERDGGVAGPGCIAHRPRPKHLRCMNDNAGAFSIVHMESVVAVAANISAVLSRMGKKKLQ